MRKLFVNIGLLLMVMNASGQSRTEYFNENNFADWQLENIDSAGDKYYRKGNETARIINFKDRFKVELQELDSPMILHKMYDKASRKLQISGRTFYDFSIGKWRYYDGGGNLRKEIDWDENFPFRVEDLCQLIKTEYGVNLMVAAHPKKNEDVEYSVERRFDKFVQKFCYVVVLQYLPPDEGYNGRKKEVFVDGGTGKILYEDGWTWGALPKSKNPVPVKNDLHINQDPK